MKCQRCGIDLTGGLGAYSWYGEVTALGEDAAVIPETGKDDKVMKDMIFKQLQSMTAEQIERDVYQQWEGLLCRNCRNELGEVLDLFFNRKGV